MKYFLFLQSFFLVISFSVIGQTGKVYDDLSMTSSILNGERKFAIYLPPDYETSHRSYPVLYLLHGSGDDQTGWIQFGEVLRIADKAILEGTATPMIIVMPDAPIQDNVDISTISREIGVTKISFLLNFYLMLKKPFE